MGQETQLELTDERGGDGFSFLKGPFSVGHGDGGSSLPSGRGRAQSERGAALSLLCQTELQRLRLLHRRAHFLRRAKEKV